MSKDAAVDCQSDLHNFDLHVSINVMFWFWVVLSDLQFDDIWCACVYCLQYDVYNVFLMPFM